MEIMLITYWIILALFGGIILGKYLYDKGYDKREEVFQDNPIIFVVGKENALWVKNGEVVKVKIYNKKLVEFIN